MMTTQTPLNSDDPRLVAFQEYQNSPEYQNSRKWAAQDKYRDGSMWAAFEQGWDAAHRTLADAGRMTLEDHLRAQCEWNQRELERVCAGISKALGWSATLHPDSIVGEVELQVANIRIAAPALREALADLCHSQWSGWMQYLFSKSLVRGDNSTVIPREFSERWLRQMNTPYAELSEAEKNSDRTEADKFIALLANAQEAKPTP